MRYTTAKNRFHKTIIRNKAFGRALGNATYLRQIEPEKYEIWMLDYTYVQNPETGNYERKHKQVSLFNIEPYGNETLITIVNHEPDNLTASYRISKWTGLFTAIRDAEMRFNIQGYRINRSIESWPVLKAGMQFIVNSMGNLRVKEGQRLETSRRYIDPEMSKPVKANFQKLRKFGQLLTSMDAVTYADTRIRDRHMSELPKVIAGEMEPTLNTVCDVLWHDFWYNEKTNTDADQPVRDQLIRFERTLKVLKRRMFKQAGAYKSKEFIGAV